MSESRKDVLLKALEAEVGGASVDPGTLFTDDVVGWSPYATVSGLRCARRARRPPGRCVLERRHHVRGDSTRWATRRSPNGSSRPITRGRWSSTRTRSWTQRDGMSALPASPWPTSATGKIRSYRTYFDDLSLIEQIVGA